MCGTKQCHKASNLSILFRSGCHHPISYTLLLRISANVSLFRTYLFHSFAVSRSCCFSCYSATTLIITMATGEWPLEWGMSVGGMGEADITRWLYPSKQVLIFNFPFPIFHFQGKTNRNPLKFVQFLRIYIRLSLVVPRSKVAPRNFSIWDLFQSETFGWFIGFSGRDARIGEK